MHSERTVIGEILLGSDIMAELAGKLTPEDFTDPVCVKLYAVALALWRSNRPVDPSVIISELGNDRATIGGIAEIQSQAIKRGAVSYHAQKIREASDKRKLARILKTAHDSERTASELSAELTLALGEFVSSPAVGRDMFVDAIRFMSTVPDRVDWMVDGLIERGANGIIAGVPKASKSWVAIELALSCATGSPFLGTFRVHRPCRVALISREDNPALTGWRTKALFAGRAWINPNLIESNLIVNTRMQSDALFLDNQQDVLALVAELQRHRTELAIFDVFNVLHGKDENDNQEMRQVLQKLTYIQTEAKCAIALVHHFNKSTSGSWTERLRGSSAISGWVEWLIGVTIEDEETKLRRLEFELKAAQPPGPFYYQIESVEGKCEATLRAHKAPEQQASSQQRFM